MWTQHRVHARFLDKQVRSAPDAPILELLSCGAVVEHLVVGGLADDRLRAQAARIMHEVLRRGDARINEGEA